MRARLTATWLCHVSAALLLLGAASPQASTAQAPTNTNIPRSVNLSQGWLFQPDPLGIGDKQGWHRPDFDRSGWRAVTVPRAWDYHDAVMDGYEGIGWYALELRAGLINPGAWQRLLFGRVNHHATVWIDGNKAGEDQIGYLPFEIPASPWLKPGRPAWVVVRVENGVRYDWLPGSTTVEWVQYGGLLEPVEMLTTAPAHIAHVSIRAAPRGEDGKVAVQVEVANASRSRFEGKVVFEAEGGAAEAPARVEPGKSATVSLELVLPRVGFWSLETPVLLDATLRLHDATGELDSVTDRFGVRAITTQGRQILLNGRPLRIRGVNRYDEFPGRGPVADDRTIRADLQAIKAAGANLVRVHYPQSPAHLRIADELGLLYMEEVPLNWWRATFRPKAPPEFDNDRIIDSAEVALERMVRRDGNHPSLVIWSVANECEATDDLGIRAMERLLKRAKSLDPTRLATYVTNQDPARNRAFALADLVALNLYFGMWEGPVAENLSQLEELVFEPTRRQLARTAAQFPAKPVLLTEFGTIGIPGSGGDVRFSEDYQAAYLSAVWRAVEATPEVSGGIVWCWADYRHRGGFTNDFPAYFGPFGLVTIDRRQKKALETMHALWTRESRRGD